jgi:predicted acylesterase/phospholipase RssA
MTMLARALTLRRSRSIPLAPARPRLALALSGGGVIGGMYQVGALTALEERLDGAGPTFDIYVGCSAGSVVASLLANGIPAAEIYRVLEEDLPDPLNFRRAAVFSSDSFRHAAGRFGRIAWALGKRAFPGLRGCIPDMLARAEHELPPGLFSLAVLERFLREAYQARGLTNSFAELPRPLLIPAVDVDRAERVVFGRDELRDVPISQAIAASSAIPGFFEPYTINGRDYVDGAVGFSGHADLAAEAGADVVFIVHPLVPSLLARDGRPMRSRGLYTIMEQANRIYGQNLLHLGLAIASARFPQTRFVVLEPPRTRTPLFGPSMSFDVARDALHFGYSSTKEWLEVQGEALLGHLLARPASATTPLDGAPAVQPPSRLWDVVRTWRRRAAPLVQELPQSIAPEPLGGLAHRGGP